MTPAEREDNIDSNVEQIGLLQCRRCVQPVEQCKRFLDSELSLKSMDPEVG
jgi:hypothetical protein